MRNWKYDSRDIDARSVFAIAQQPAQISQALNKRETKLQSCTRKGYEELRVEKYRKILLPHVIPQDSYRSGCH